jgi:PPK2 family polyphosphate:nucleotide phosphotransferase
MERYRVKPGGIVRLGEIDPGDKSGFDGSKKEAKKKLVELTGELEALQELLYAEHRHKILVVLQGMDTSGKDGTIRHVFEGVNPQGVRVISFKEPTPEELDHDYLWRVHQHTPGRGEIVIFNRSHYEDVLIVRVHALVPEKQWSRRYQQIVDFERTLVAEGTTILKFFLHIDQNEQRQRLQARLDDPDKHWKFNVEDLKERKRWDEYTGAYEDVLNKTSTEEAPWYVVPANRKWYRNLVIATVLVDTLKGLKMAYPEQEEDLTGIVIE